MMEKVMRKARKLVYATGYRPQRGSVLYSPSLSLLHWGKDFMNRVNKVYGRKDKVQAAPYQGSVGFIYK